MELTVFALNASRELGEKIAASLPVRLARHEEREYENGEHKARALENVRGRDVYVIHSLYGDPAQSVNDKVVRLLFFVGALKDASAGRVTAVLPYLCYARKDRRTKPRDPLSLRYLASALEAVGADHVVTLDVHNVAAYENAFRIPADHLEAKKLFVEHFAPLLGAAPVAVVSPDVGGMKRADAFCASLERGLGRTVSRAYLEKRRSDGLISGDMMLAGDVSERHAIIIDDLVSSGATLSRAVTACKAHGASRTYAAASHALFTAQANELLANPALEAIVVTDTVPPFQLEPAAAARKLSVMSCAPLFAEAIRRMNGGGSIAGLLQD